MRVKKLEIFGFKSFANRQSITFGEGVTGVVGPNGCGKSNVVDALRWVMGEQNARHLRGGNMQDIIFCGSEKKAPLGFAEVTLTLENSDQDAPLEYNHYNEIEITRRLYKTGDSEYEINRQKARLKDIADFFLGTGVGTKAYSIIEQGRVNDVISAKASDRRLIIEEAAGITKYKAKKAAAERRMEATRVNLNRIVDIKNEVDKRVAVLLREKEKLEKVQSIKNQIRDIDLHISSHHYLARSAKLAFLNASKGKLYDEITDNKREIAITELSFSKILDEYAKKHDHKRLLEDLEGQHKTTLELLKKDLEYTKVTMTDNQILVARLTSQLNDIEQRNLELENDIARFTSEHEQSLAQYAGINEKHAAQKQSGHSVVERRQNNLSDEQDTQKKIIESATRAARLQTQIAVLREQDAQKQIDIKNVALELATKMDELALSKTRVDLLTSELKQGELRNQTLQVELSAEQSRLEKEQEVGAGLTKQLRALDEEKMALSSRLKSLTEIDVGYEWSESGVTDLLASDKKHLIKGLVADVIQVKPGHEDAVEKCLSHMLDAAVVANNDDLSMVAAFLKNKKSAETAFILLNHDDRLPNISKPIGLKSLSDLISIASADYLALLPQLARFFLADHLASAIDHWPAARLAQATIVTFDGEMLLPDGRAIILGENNGKGVLKRKNELGELGKKIAELEVFIKDRSSQSQISDQAIQVSETKKGQILQEIKPLSLGLVRLEETIKQKTLELKKVEAERQKLLEKSDSLSNNAINSDEKIVNLNKQWADALEEHKNFEDALEQIRSKRTAVEAEYDAYQHQIKEIEIARAGIYEKSQSLANTLAQANKNLLHLASQKQSFDDQIAERSHEELKLKENERQVEKKLKALSIDLDETSKMLATIQVECSTLTHQKLVQEQALAVLQSQGRETLERLHEQELQINNANNEIKNLSDRIMERYRIRLTEQLTDFHNRALDEKAATKEMDELKKTFEKMGTVNENAAKDFEEFSARSHFLETQVGDLNDALSQLESAIKKINKTTKLRFLEAFNSINKQFSLVFPRLFNGGKAELVLGDEEDLLNCGVEIMAKPPGKNISSIELMSGGEKALTAISLIMAIFLIKPSPFCLLDEVDAPLDEANVSRFSQLIKEMSQLSQFIVITHNRKTMEAADQLYGVTMEDAGMSKIVSVHVQQAFDALKQPPKAVTATGKPTQLFLDDVTA